MLQMRSLYRGKRRAGVLHPNEGLEAYLIPTCTLSARLLKTARKAAAAAGEPDQDIPQTVPEDELLMAIVHPKVSWDRKQPMRHTLLSYVKPVELPFVTPGMLFMSLVKHLQLC